MKTKRINIAIIILAAIALSSLAVCFGDRTSKTVSIGIIGGADGPTSIIITGSPSISVITVMLAVVAAGILFSVVNKRKKNKQKNSNDKSHII